ncbi:hypothetical protein [Amycolatopsis rubida]|uniref:Uncharacterized protein n=1 Tax=Amycolatopsis rubida TaxID=112413 RepID=A0A1I5X9A0_9PSEU|nr:hypothetical protein [Amycolatopsis rubida]SFQ28552.1 hypothetical protein SAMN05421854_110107 [Amycolatopsis rubida]
MEHASQPRRPDWDPPESSLSEIRAWWGSVFCGAVPRLGRAAPRTAGPRRSGALAVTDPDAARAGIETADAAHRLLWAVAATAPGARDVAAVARRLRSEIEAAGAQNPDALRAGADRVAAAGSGSLQVRAS